MALTIKTKPGVLQIDRFNEVVTTTIEVTREIALTVEFRGIYSNQEDIEPITDVADLSPADSDFMNHTHVANSNNLVEQTGRDYTTGKPRNNSNIYVKHLMA